MQNSNHYALHYAVCLSKWLIPLIMPSMMRKALTLWLAYFGLALLLTWPTVTHFTSHLPGDGGDDPAIAWNLWWLKYALLNLGQNPFDSQAMFYPIGINLAFYTLTILNGLLALPFTLNLGVVAASNLHLWFTFVVSGYGMYLLCRYVLLVNLQGFKNLAGLNFAIPALSGLFFAFASSKLFYVALGQFNIASYHWLPFAILYLLRTRHQPRRLINPCMLGFFLTLQAWSEMTYASFMLVFIALYYVWEIATNLHKFLTSPLSILTSHLRAFIIMSITFIIGLSPILAHMLPDMRAEGDFLVEGSGFAQDYSADLLGFLIPTMHHPLWGNFIQQTNIHAFDKGQHIYLGIVLLSLSLIAVISPSRRLLGFWFMAAFSFAWLTLGPHLTVNGYDTTINGPFVIFQHLPFFKGNRYPSRYAVMLILCLSITAPVGLAYLHQWLKPKLPFNSLFIIHYSLFIIFIAEHLSAPLPQSDMTIPPAYDLIAQDPNPATVLDIPFAWRNGFDITGAWTTQFMFGQFYQTRHQKPLLQGNTSRNPKLKFQYFVRAPFINSLLALETGHTLPANRQAQDLMLAPQVLQFFNIRYLVVRPYQHAANPDITQANILPYLESLLPLQTLEASPALTLYQVTLPPTPLPTHLDSNHPLMPLYMGEGWGLITPGQPLVAQRKAVRLIMPLTAQPQTLTLQLNHFMGEGNETWLEINGWQSPRQHPDSARRYQFNLPATISHDGLNDVWLHFGQPVDLQGSDLQGFENLVGLDITVQSAGEEVGGFGQIFINGHDISPNQRGFNVAIIQTDTFTVANFDTHLDPNASTALADFLHHAPPEATIALTVSDEASFNLQEIAVQALKQLGATMDLRGCFRCSYALIYRPNQPTLEALDPIQPVSLTTAFGLTEPQLTALIDWIEIKNEK